MYIFRRMFKFAAVAAAACVIVACSSDKDKNTLPSKGNMIPDDAVIAMKVDLDQLWNKALGDQDSDVRSYWNMGKSMLSMSAGELGEMGDVVKQIVKDPSTSGLCVDEPMVVSFAADIKDVNFEEFDVDVCLVALLDDSNAFVKVADAFMAVANEEGELGMTKEIVSDSYTYYSCPVEEDVTLDLGVFAEAAVLRLKANTISQNQGLKENMLELFADGGPDNTEGLDAFYASKGDMALWLDFETVLDMALPILENENPGVTAQLEAYMPMYENASMVSELTFKDGQTVLQFMIFGSEEMKKYGQKFNAVSSDKFFQYIPRTSAMVMNFAFADMPGLVEEFSKMGPDYAEAIELLKENLGIDEELLAGLPGVITLALSVNSVDQDVTPGIYFIMDCKENVWEFAKTYLDMYAEDCGNDTYVIEDMCVITYNNDTLYAMDMASYNDGEVYDSFLNSPHAKDIAKGGFVFDLAAFPEDILDSLAEEFDYEMSGSELLEYVSSVVVTVSDDHMTSTLEVNMDDKEHNLLEKLVLYVISSAF